MIKHFKSALNQIKAEEDLVNRTELYLKNKFSKHRSNSLFFFHAKSYFKAKLVIICLTFLIVAAGTGSYAYYMTPISYLSIDINPSIELGVNIFGKVVRAEGYNKDGNMILKNIKIAGKNVESSVKFIVSSAVYGGYINDDGSTIIAITSETDNLSTAEKLENEAESGTNFALKENGKAAVIYKYNVPLSIHEKAKQIGITAGKLNLINKLQSVDPTASIESFKDVSVKEIMKAFKIRNIEKNADNDKKNINIDNEEKDKNVSKPSYDIKEDHNNKKVADEKNVTNQKKEGKNSENDNTNEHVPENNIKIDEFEDKGDSNNSNETDESNETDKNYKINENSTMSDENNDDDIEDCENDRKNKNLSPDNKDEYYKENKNDENNDKNNDSNDGVDDEESEDNKV